MYFDERTSLLVSFADLRLRQHVFSRRLALKLLAATVVVPALGPPLRADDESSQTTYDLQVPWEAGTLQQYRAVLEVKGELRWKPKDKDVQKSPFEARGELLYTERLLANEDGAARRTARHYEQADVDYRIGKQSKKRSISEHQRLILAQLDGDAALLTCPQQPMTREELDLLDIPANSIVLPSILPNEPIKVGETWGLATDAVAALMGVDEISEHTLVGTLRNVEANVAQLEFTGKVTGRVQGTKTEMKLNAKSNIDLDKRRISWFTLAVREEREIGDALPGLEATARLRLVAQPCDVIPALNDEVVAGLPPADKLDHQILRFVSSEGGYEMLVDRRWRVIVDRSDVTILRLFEEGALIGQVVISPLNDAPPDKDVSLAAFQDEVKQSLVKHTGQIIEAAEGGGNGGLRVLRVTAAGVVSEVSMQWVYYHVSNADGRRVAFVYTVQTDLIEQFGERDRAMMETFAFRALPEKSAGEPAVEAAQASPSNKTAKERTKR